MKPSREVDAKTELPSWAGLFKALGHPIRLGIMMEVGEGPRTVGHLASLFGVESSTMSQHLRILRMSGLVRARKEKNRIFYYAVSNCVEKLVDCLESTSDPA